MGGAAPNVTEHDSSRTQVSLGFGTERARSAAVIPFSVDPTEADSAQLAEGVSERILNALIWMPELKVLARASLAPGTAPTVPTSGRLEGSSVSITSSMGPSSEPGRGDASACSWWRLPPATSAGQTRSSGHSPRSCRSTRRWCAASRRRCGSSHPHHDRFRMALIARD